MNRAASAFACNTYSYTISHRAADCLSHLAAAEDAALHRAPPVLAEVGYERPPMLEIISMNADSNILASAEALAAMGLGHAQ